VAKHLPVYVRAWIPSLVRCTREAGLQMLLGLQFLGCLVAWEVPKLSCVTCISGSPLWWPRRGDRLEYREIHWGLVH
jgi:hypothetical protein